MLVVHCCVAALLPPVVPASVGLRCGIPSPGPEELPMLLFSQDGRTALSLACRNRHWGVARWLIDDQDVDLVRLCAVAYGQCCQHDRRGRVS
jgi:hypothetical protein